MKMQIKFKIILAITLSVLFMAILPWAAMHLADGLATTGLWFFDFFTVNPLLVIGLSIMAGTDIRKLWWIPLAIAVSFPLLFSLAIGEMTWDLYIYSSIYLPVGCLAMLGTFLGKRTVHRRRKEGGEVD